MLAAPTPATTSPGFGSDLLDRRRSSTLSSRCAPPTQLRRRLDLTVWFVHQTLLAKKPVMGRKSTKLNVRRSTASSRSGPTTDAAAQQNRGLPADARQAETSPRFSDTDHRPVTRRKPYRTQSTKARLPASSSRLVGCPRKRSDTRRPLQEKSDAVVRGTAGQEPCVLRRSRVRTACNDCRQKTSLLLPGAIMTRVSRRSTYRAPAAALVASSSPAWRHGWCRRP